MQRGPFLSPGPLQSVDDRAALRAFFVRFPLDECLAMMAPELWSSGPLEVAMTTGTPLYDSVPPDTLSLWENVLGHFFCSALLRLIIGTLSSFGPEKLSLTPIINHAALRGDSWIVPLLLADDRVNMEAVTEGGRTPLHLACQKGNAEIVEMLLSNGANPNAVEEHEDRWTPLLYAVGAGNTACVHALMKANVDLNKGNCRDQTALFIAVLNGNIHMVKLLLKAKADWSAKDNDGHMPVDVVKEEHREPVESLFMETLIGMVQEHEVFCSTILCGITQDTCLLKTLEPDVVPHIAGYCDVPMGDALEKIRLELNRLCSGRRGRKRKHSGCME